MYEIDVDYQDSFKYTVRSPNYEIKIDFPKDDGSIEGITPPALLRKAKRRGLRKSPMSGDKSHRRRRFSWRKNEHSGFRNSGFGYG